MADITFGSVNGNYSDDTKWVGGVEPTAADNALLSSLSANPTIDTTSLVCRSLDCNTFGGTLIEAAAATTLTIGDGTAGAGNIALRLNPYMSLSLGNGTVGFTFVSTSATQQSIDYSGKTTGNTIFNGSGASWILTGSVVLGVFAQLKLIAGTLNTNGVSISCGNVFISGATTRSLTLGSSQITLTGTNTTVWDATTVTNLTSSLASSSIIIGVADSNTRTFKGGGLTYGNLSYILGGSTGELDITGSNTFSTINFSDGSNARSLKFTAGTTTTITNQFNIYGSSGKLITIDSLTGAAHTLSKSSGIVACDYLSLTNSQAGGGATWYAGSHSVDNGGNTGWIFTDPPASSSLSIFGDDGMIC